MSEGTITERLMEPFPPEAIKEREGGGRRRGYAGPIDSRAHASSLIDVYTRGGRVETGGAS